MNIGIVGIGFMGSTHFIAAKGLQGARVSAICTRDEKKLAGDWRNIQGNFGEGGGVQDLSGIDKYRTLDELLADPKIDIVDLCLPTYLHPDAVKQSLAAGKHVLVEKPIALTVEDANEMIALSKQTGKHLMVAQVLRFFPEFAFIKEVAADGRYGALLGAHFKRIISRPNWGGGDWFLDPSKNGGPVIDLHIHDADFVRHLAGMPNELFASGLMSPNGEVYYLTANYLYEGRNLAITATSGAIAMSGRPFEHGYDVYFEKATLQFNSSWGQPVTLLTADGQVTHPEISTVDAFTAELQYAVDTVAGKVDGSLLSAESARDSLLLCHRAAQSVQRREVVSI